MLSIKITILIIIIMEYTFPDRFYKGIKYIVVFEYLINIYKINFSQKFIMLIEI